MITPICASATSGSTPSTANTAASRMPALVITPPVAASERIIASREPCVRASSTALDTRKML